jgi:hypothetical protein
MIKTFRLLTAFLFVTHIAFGQASQSGDIYGRITDEKNQALDFVTIRAEEGGVSKGGAKSDINGNYKIKPLSPGKYDIIVTYAGYQTEKITGVLVGSDKSTKLDVKMEKATKVLKTAKVSSYRVPLIDPHTTTNKVIDRVEIKQAANNNSVSDLVGLNAGSYQRKSNDQISVGGDRTTGTIYMVDGIPIRVRGGNAGVNLPTSAIDQLELIGNGMSAKYGNATGGVVGITTRGIQSKTSGSVQAQHSIEGYNNNLISVDLAGPLLKQKVKGGTEKRTILGYSVNGAFTYDKDNNPSHFKNYKLTDEAKARLEANPLIANPTGALNFVSAATAVTQSDFQRVRARDNASAWGANLIGKIDFQPSENLGFTVFTNFVRNVSNDYEFKNSAFSPQANPQTSNYSTRSYVRMTQKLGKSSDKLKEDAKISSITNAFYSIQLIYQKDFNDRTNRVHQDNLFNYNYLGRFQSFNSQQYRLDSSVGGYRGLALQNRPQTDSIKFIPAGINPVLENYTKSIFADSRFKVGNASDIAGFGGLLNGDGVGNVYGGLMDNIGDQNNLYTFRNADQINVNLEASFDIEQGAKKGIKQKDKITHNIQFGLGYEQRTTREFRMTPGAGNVGAANLWRIMRLNANRQFADLDKNNPIFVIGGQNYTLQDLQNGTAEMSVFDTIKYNPLYTASLHSRFDKELRKKLNLPGGELNTTFLDIDNMDPSTFNIDMFEADDFFNNGQDIVSYFGYDYKGNRIKRQPSFNDFWTKKDARGDFERPIGSFRPIYMFGYILDRFSYKDLNFNIGLRIDRYDANQKVLRDPYSLYGVRKNSDLQPGTYLTATSKADGSQAPQASAFDSDYVPYVNTNDADVPTIVGYRNGDVWYDPFGKEISDPTVLSGLYAGGNPIQPWLQDKTQKIKESNYKVDNAFEDFKPQISVSPRIKFSFPISEEALFYGNYDVITQQPSVASQVTPDDYFYLFERQGTISNANLKMERAVNYSLGYQQKLSSKASLTFEAYYRERRNQIQLQRLILAYPITYQTYGNRDFSSTTGTTVSLDFRRNGPLRVKIDYTLQFAEGTGSDASSQRSLLNTNQPNLRSVFPLNNDARHTLISRIDYRFNGDNMRGPKVGKYYPFENSGINLIARARSGEPYSKTALATLVEGGDFNGQPMIGSINGSRLPWNYELNLKLDKSLKIATIGKKKDNEGNSISGGRPFFVNFYVLVTNLLNTRNILGAYRFTGLGDDDGFLTSPQGIQYLSTLQFQESVQTLYQIRLLNPDNFNNPRRINLGLTFDF